MHYLMWLVSSAIAENVSFVLHQHSCEIQIFFCRCSVQQMAIYWLTRLWSRIQILHMQLQWTSKLLKRLSKSYEQLVLISEIRLALYMLLIDWNNSELNRPIYIKWVVKTLLTDNLDKKIILYMSNCCWYTWDTFWSYFGHLIVFIFYNLVVVCYLTCFECVNLVVLEIFQAAAFVNFWAFRVLTLLVTTPCLKNDR